MSGSCSVCFKRTDTFPSIQFPYDFTLQICELREEDILPGTHDIDPMHLQLCQDCFDIVDDRVEQKLREDKTKKHFIQRKNEAKFLSNDSVKTETSSAQNGDQQ